MEGDQSMKGLPWPAHETMMLVLLHIAFSTAGAAQTSDPGRGVPVSLPSTYEHSLRSTLADREFVIWVSLPPAYNSAGPGIPDRFPVLYLLDGRQSLQLALPTLRLTNRGRAGDLILVGIGYPLDERGLPSCGTVLCRDVDYVPPALHGSNPYAAEGLPPGGADVFLRILREEIIPFVEAHYRTSGDRGLYGYSQGGLFTMYALFEAPDLFGRYAAASSGAFLLEDMLARERAFRSRTPSLRKLVYLSVGANEAPYFIEYTWRLIGALCGGMFSGKAYDGLTLLAAIHPNEGPSSVAHVARALAALYPPSEGDTAQPPVRDMNVHCTPH